MADPTSHAHPVDPPPSKLTASASPLKKGSNHFTAATVPTAQQQRRGHRLSMEGKIVLVDYEMMMDKYVPSPSSEEPSDERFATDFKYRGPKKGEQESAMYEPLADSINSACFKKTEFKVVGTYSKSDPTDKSKLRVDGAVYRNISAPEDDDPANWSAVELTIEFKTDPTQDDPFDDADEMCQPSSGNRRDNLGQIMSYAALVFVKQQRTHHFSVILFGNMARIVRWDRAGAIVTEKFNYATEPAKLGRFFWRFARMSDTQRGHDPTATLILTSDPEYELMQERGDTPMIDSATKHPLGERVRKLFKQSLKSNVPWWKLRVDDKDGPRYFLVGAPHFVARGLAGRATHGYIAIDMADSKGPFVYLKDAWRVAHERIEQEGKILSDLNDKSTGPSPGIPTLVAHGDVDDQVTVSQALWKELHPGEEAKCPLKTHYHYRLVVKEVGLPMSSFKNARELVKLTIQCAQAHLNAYKKGIIHRDISEGNVLILVKEVIDPDGTLREIRSGLLTDWELSKRVDDDGGPRQTERTGTWQFLSAMALNIPGKVIEICDEMESFFHLLLWFAIRFLPHNLPDVGQFVKEYFDDSKQVNGEFVCGLGKELAVSKGMINIPTVGRLTFFLPAEVSSDASAPLPNPFPDAPAGATQSTYSPIHPINGLLKEMLKLIHSRYVLYNQRIDPDFATTSAVARPSAARVPDENEDEDEEAYYASLALNNTESLSATTPEEVKRHEANANRLQSQSEVIALLAGFYAAKLTWPTNDKVEEDQLPENYGRDQERDWLPATGSKRSMLHDNADREEPEAKRRSVRLATKAAGSKA